MPTPNDDRSRVKDPMQDEFRDDKINRGNQIRETKKQQGQQEQGGQAQGGQGAGSGPGQGTGAGQKKPLQLQNWIPEALGAAKGLRSVESCSLHRA